MHILSWNVAGWGTTLHLIRQNHGSLENFMTKHQIDILALQEVKATKSKLSETPDIYGATRASFPSSYESYWACCSTSDSKGFNGVGTYSRKGFTLGATSTIFANKKLDSEGRCLVTDHGHFVLFNVYCPNSGNGSEIRRQLKLEFHQKLTEAMRAIRLQGRPVILVGDFNVSARAEDLAPAYRLVRVDQVLSYKIPSLPELKKGDTMLEMKDQPHVAQVLADLRTVWPQVLAMLRSKRLKTEQIKCSRGMVTKYRVVVDGPAKSRKGGRNGGVKGKTTSELILGKPFDSERRALGAYCFEEPSNSTVSSSSSTHTAADSASTAEDQDDEQGVAEADVDLARDGLGAALTVEELIECVHKASASIRWTSEQRSVLSRLPCLTTWSNPEYRDWLTDLSAEDNMLDAFKAFHPRARDRLTCWDQSKNKRYINKGSRIDYTMVDECLGGFLRRGHCLYGGRCPYDNAPNTSPMSITPIANPSVHTSRNKDSELAQTTMMGNNLNSSNSLQVPLCEGTIDCTCERCGCTCAHSDLEALQACTAFGRWKAAPFEGGGLGAVLGTTADYDSQFQTPHTGIVYTPPTYSDHVGVSLLLSSELTPPIQASNSQQFHSDS